MQLSSIRLRDPGKLEDTANQNDSYTEVRKHVPFPQRSCSPMRVGTETKPQRSMQPRRVSVTANCNRSGRPTQVSGGNDSPAGLESKKGPLMTFRRTGRVVRNLIAVLYQPGLPCRIPRRGCATEHRTRAITSRSSQDRRLVTDWLVEAIPVPMSVGPVP